MPAGCLHARPAPKRPRDTPLQSLQPDPGGHSPLLEWVSQPWGSEAWTSSLMQSWAHGTQTHLSGSPRSWLMVGHPHGRSGVAWGEFHRRGTERSPLVGDMQQSGRVEGSGFADSQSRASSRVGSMLPFRQGCKAEVSGLFPEWQVKPPGLVKHLHDSFTWRVPTAVL